MRLSLTLALSLTTAAFAVPAPDNIFTERQVTSVVQNSLTVVQSTATSVVACATSTYNPKISATPMFTDLSCQISKALTPGQPLSCAFPTADQVGAILGPFLVSAIGTDTIDDIDVIAEDLCISAEEDQADGNGLCDNILQLVRDLAASQAKDSVNTYNCLLNLLCVARASPKHTGTCQYLLAGADCVANRILKVPGDPECDGTGAK